MQAYLHCKQQDGGREHSHIQAPHAIDFKSFQEAYLWSIELNRAAASRSEVHDALSAKYTFISAGKLEVQAIR